MGPSWLTRLLCFMPSYPEVLLAMACFLFLHYIGHRRRHDDGLPMSWPVIGMLPYLITKADRIHDWSTDVLRLSGCSFVFEGIWGIPGDVLLTCDPANVNHVFNANFPNFPKGDDFAELFDILGNGIFNADHESWSFQRRKAHSLMTDPKFRDFMVRANQDKLEKGLLPLLDHAAGRGQVLDLQDVFLRLTFDTTTMFIFGADPGCLAVDLPVVPFAQALDDAENCLFFRNITPPFWWKTLRWLRAGPEKRMAEAREVIDQFIAQCISKLREEKHRLGSNKEAEEEDGRGDLLTSYLDSEAVPVGSGASWDHLDQFLRDTTLNLMVAGRDTTSSGLTWFFWLVSKNPEVEAKILEELRVHSPRNPGMPSATELRSLVYLHAALCESLRLYPPVPFEHKGVVQPETLPSGVHIHEKRRMLFSLYAMGRMEAIWGKDCLEFKPERWISESGRLRYEPSYKYLVFNAGPRTCLGKDIAFTQMKAVAAAMIANFRVEVVEGHEVRPKLSIILHMKDGLKVRVKKRVGF